MRPELRPCAPSPLPGEVEAVAAVCPRRVREGICGPAQQGGGLNLTGGEFPHRGGNWRAE